MGADILPAALSPGHRDISSRPHGHRLRSEVEISGLATAWILAQRHKVTFYESGKPPGQALRHPFRVPRPGSSARA